MKKLSLKVAALALCAGAVTGLVNAAHASDRYDTPRIAQDPAADIGEFYGFPNPQNTNNIVLAMTVNSDTPAGVKRYFSPDVMYQFKVDNDGDFMEDLVFQVTFSAPAADGTQQMQVAGPVALPRGTRGAVNIDVVRTRLSGVRILKGVTDAPASYNVSGIGAFAGLADDPKFVDGSLVGSFFSGGAAVGTGQDACAGLNASAIVLDVPKRLIRGKLPTGGAVRIWATTSRRFHTDRGRGTDATNGRYVQVDRAGNPLMSSDLLPAQFRDAYNSSAPVNDYYVFRYRLLDGITALTGDELYAATVIDGPTQLLPDVLTLQLENWAGFPNGRRLQDDVDDVSLNLFSQGAITSDGISANDVPFQTTFPFLAPAH